MARSNRKNNRKRVSRDYGRANKKAGKVLALTLLFVAAVFLSLYGLYVTGRDTAPDTEHISRTAPEKAPSRTEVKDKTDGTLAQKDDKTGGSEPAKSLPVSPDSASEPADDPVYDKEQAHIAGYKPKVVIIVDDVGMHKGPIDELLKLKGPLTLAVLPNLPYSEYAAQMAHKKGWDVILHLPMEPMESSGYTAVDAGEDALLVGLPKDTILAKLDANLASVPYIDGVNNHMGSKFMENEELMDLVLERMMSKGLYFVDSLTTPRSVGYDKAMDLGMKSAKRDIFLDRSAKGPDYVRSQMIKLIDISEKKGYAIGICHPYPDTIAALAEMLPEIDDRVELVTASEVVISRKELSGL